MVERNQYEIPAGLTGAVLLLAAFDLAACGSDDDAGGDPGAEATPDKQSVVDISNPPGSVEEYVGAAEDAEVESCAPGGNGLEVAGTVTTPESDAQDYRLYVSAMAGDDTVGLVQVDVEGVVGGETAEWETQMDLTQDDVECVLRVERFAAE